MLKRPLWLAIGVLVLWWWWPSSERASTSHPQAAVLADGFLATDRTSRVIELEPDGTKRHELEVRGLDNPRVVGFASGMIAVWRDGKKIGAAVVDSGGRVGKPEWFGRNAQLMCEGTGSNELRFAVGWTEADGAVWFLSGPTKSNRVERAEARLVVEPAAGVTARPTFCAVATAGPDVALLWNDGDRWFTVTCGKQCPSLTTRVEVPKGHKVLGFGCLKDACVVATRHGQTLEASWVTTKGSKGKRVWAKPLRDAAPDTRVELVGTGSQVAIAYGTANEPVVVTASRDGTLATVWQGEADGVPSIQWAAGTLVVARHVDGELTGSVVRAP